MVFTTPLVSQSENCIGYCISILPKKKKGNGQKLMGEYGVTSYFCHINAFSTCFPYILSYYILYVIQMSYYMSILQKYWREMVKNSWNGTVSTIVTLVTLWHDVTGSGSYQRLFTSIYRYLVQTCSYATSNFL